MILKSLAKIYRKKLSRIIFNRHKGMVQYGPYKGLMLDGTSNVSEGPLALKVLGLYESQVVKKIKSLKFETLVNLGAADGYMALGPLFNKQCQRSICFEMTEKGRKAVIKNASLNHIPSKNLIVRGIADKTLLTQLHEIGIEPKKCLFLCDIEGAEFEVFSTKLLEYLKGASFIIELHDRHLPEGTTLRKKLINKLPTGANFEILSDTSSQNFKDIPDLENLSDNERALVMSEGRKYFGEWLYIHY